MDSEKRARLMFVFTLILVAIVGGCISTGGPEWEWQRCYTGPSRDLAEVSVLLISRHPVPLSIHSIDGERVRDVTEYHLLPGNHVVESKPEVPRRFLIEYKNEARTLVSEPTGECTTGAAKVAVTLEPGIVYRLNANLAWETDGTSRIYWQARGGKWCPHVEALGSFEKLQDALARQRERFRTLRREKRGPSEVDDIPWPYVELRTLAEPPKHWISARDGK